MKSLSCTGRVDKNYNLWSRVPLSAAALSLSKRPDTVTNVFVMICLPTIHDSVPSAFNTNTSGACVRGEVKEVVHLFEHSSLAATEYVSYAYLNPKGGDLVPSFIVNSVSRKNNGSRILKLRKAFQERRSLEDLDERDGAVLGVDLFCSFRSVVRPPRSGADSLAAVRRGAVAAFLGRHGALKRAVAADPPLEELLLAALESRLTMTPVCGKAVEELTRERMIGASFFAVVLLATSPETGVDEWIRFFPALEELQAKYVW